LGDALAIHTVQPGQTLSSIAAFYYTDGNAWPQIVAANDFLAGDPNTLEIGDQLVIPQPAQ